MKVTVKIVQGEECVVDVIPTESVLDLKQKVQQSLGIDVEQQKLLLTGKALSDKNPISFYPGIKDGAKLNLIVKKAGQTSQSKPGLINLQNEITRVLKQFYREQEAKSIASEVATELKSKAHHLSYDDLERLATALLRDQENLS